MASPVLVQSETHCSKGQTHPRSSECDCGQTVPTGPSHSDGMVPPSGGIQPPLSNLAPSPGRHVCDQVQLQANQVCVSSTRPQCLGSGYSNSLLGGPGHICLSPSVVTGQSGQQIVRSSVQESDTDSSVLAQHAVVLGSGRSVVPDTLLSPKPPRSGDSTVQQGSSQGSSQSQSSRLAPRAKAIKEQGFSSPVAVRIEFLKDVQPDQSMRQSGPFLLDGVKQVRWTSGRHLSVADFLLHLFQEKNLQPSTIDGYRSAIVDKLGNASLNVTKDENLTCLLDIFHRDRPKGGGGGGGVPSWNLSLVLHQLTKPPFEPLRKVSLKHLTFKIVFLLALGSGKRRGEIHACLNKNIRHQADWTKVSLYPSQIFG